MKNKLFAMSIEDVTNSTVVTVLVRLLLEFYMPKTDKRSDTVKLPRIK